MHHTPDPWTVHQDGPAKIPTIESPSGPVAMLYAGESAAANARLIAAAPDLIAALKHALDRLESIPAHRDETGIYRHAAAIARAAINKALGE